MSQTKTTCLLLVLSTLDFLPTQMNISIQFVLSYVCISCHFFGFDEKKLVFFCDDYNFSSCLVLQMVKSMRICKMFSHMLMKLNI